MRKLSTGSFLRLALIALALALLAACGSGGGARPDVVQAANIPASFDVTLVAEKDTQFDYQDAPLTVPDLRSAFRFRKDEGLPLSTVLLKRGEKEKVRKEHISAILRIAGEMDFKVYLLEKSGQISELQAR
ncbi:MAG: hypothetical protein J0H15_14125 [Xanthomonadales bacterium]|nr:hypothetical protein [Xanthomonadales bacterium]